MTKKLGYDVAISVIRVSWTAEEGSSEPSIFEWTLDWVLVGTIADLKILRKIVQQ